MTTVITYARARAHSTSTVPVVALAVILVALSALWTVPVLGLPLSIAVLGVLAPWGRRLGERALVTAVTLIGTAAGILASAWAGGQPVPQLVWPLLISLLLVLTAAAVWARGTRWAGRAPVWPQLESADVVVAVVFIGCGVVGVAPYIGASVPVILSALLSGWDHSSHLPMFIQTVHAQGWSVASLGGDAMFAVYPMLHVGLWAAGEAVLGTGPDTQGMDLVRSYVMWSAMTTAAAAALLVWSAARVTRTLGGGSRASLTAAAITGGWCLLGTLTLMADFAFANFLLASAVALAAVVAGARSRRAVDSVGWFVLPIGAVAVAYLYPPMVAGVALAAVVWLAVLVRERSRTALALVGVGVLAALAAAPAVRLVTEPFQGRAVGDIKGGIPNVEISLALGLGLAVALMLVLVLRPVSLATRLALTAPIVGTALVALVFALQAMAADVALSDSYYTKKVLYGLLLIALPLAAAIVGLLAQRALGQVFRRSAWPVVATVGVAVLLLSSFSAVTSAFSAPANRGSIASVPLPPGLWSLLGRIDGAHASPAAGLAQLIAARSEPGWIGIVAVRSMSDVQSGRTAAGLGSLLTWRVNDVIESAHDDIDSVRRQLRADRSLRLHWVLVDAREAPAVRGLIEEFGPDRIRMDIVGR